MKVNKDSISLACDILMNTLIDKNRDYGNSVEEQFNEYGPSSLLIRLDDKLRRLKQLQNHPQHVKTESKQDTLLDIAGYAILGYLCLEEGTAFDSAFHKYFGPDDQHD
jgi:glutaredoxin 2